MKKLVCLLLVCVLVLGMLPSAFAAEAKTFLWDTMIPSGGAQIPDDVRIGRSTLTARARQLEESESNDDFDKADRIKHDDVIVGNMDGDDVDIFVFTVSRLSDVAIAGVAERDSLAFATGRLEDEYGWFSEDLGYNRETGLYEDLIYVALPAGTYYIVAQDEYYETADYMYGLALYIEDHVHEWDGGKVTTAATCSKKGVKTYTCEGCGETKTESIPATGKHTWNSGKVTTAATCSKKGVKTYTCTGCGTTKTESIAATGKHNNTKTGTVAPTCTQEGYSVLTCSDCGHTTHTSVTSALGHAFDGNTCSRCGVAYGEHFVDVPSTKYYFETVKWASLNNITSGTDAIHFSPENPCSRAQVVTFLWRANGSPAPTITKHPFTDVTAGSYYYDAMLWAVEKGITNGISATEFGPTATCTRAQVVTFLWRASGSPAPGTTKHPFTDVAAGSYYYNAMLWAVEKGITTGATETTFAPSKVCNRAQVVTFLFRAK